MTAPAKWKPLQRAAVRQGVTEQDIDQVLSGVSGPMPPDARQQARQALEREVEGCSYWVNDLYQVQLRPLPAEGGRPALVHLNIRRRDGKPIFRDWRHFQQIKNELVGAECEAVELYPAESRLSDTSNKYHLFVVPDPTYRFPFGFTKRDVLDADETVPHRAGFRQRRLS
jgi:hypothetical protein